MSFNVRSTRFDSSDRHHAWNKGRKERAFQIIMNNDPDVIGL